MVQFTLRQENYGKGMLQMRLNISKDRTTFLVLLFENDRGVPEFKEGDSDYFVADRIFTGLLIALKLGRGISLEEEDEE